MTQVKWLVDKGVLDGDKLYVWFKNNCPCYGSLYDDIRFSTIANGEEFCFGFCPRSGHRNDKTPASFWILGKNIELQTFEFSDLRTMKKAILTEHKEMLTKHFETIFNK